MAIVVTDMHVADLGVVAVSTHVGGVQYQQCPIPRQLFAIVAAWHIELPQ